MGTLGKSIGSFGAFVAGSAKLRDLLVNTAPGKQLWVMPSLVSQPLERVERFCRLHRLRLGRAREVNYPGIPSGLVLRQYPPAGSPVAPSEIITVWVSQ